MARTSTLGSGGPLYGAEAPIPFSGVGAVFVPHWASVGSTLNSTSTRLYYIPFYFPRAGFVYTGLKTYNGGSGDNGETLRLGVYQASQTTGMPSSLVVDAGEITLTGASAIRTLASSWTAPYKGWGWLCCHNNTAASMVAMRTRRVLSAAGVVVPNVAQGFFGVADFSAALDDTGAGFGGVYVDTAYGALASTAVAPTGIVDQAPIVAPYKT